ncbi:MAG TPA: hypothetical protein VHS28_10900 [Chloroflexota bacterium]|nr:hypothetical protein [Chloroflexota bacterium]
MMLSYERGDVTRPKGHALLYFKGWSDPSAVFATYIIVPPIAVEISKYIPPMFANQLQQLGGGGIAVFPYPPIPERVDSLDHLTRLAQARDDDLISGGTVDTSSPERLLQAASEAAQQYLESYLSRIQSIETAPEPGPALPESESPVDVNELMYGLMGDRDRLAELSKLSGQLRYAVGGGDTQLAEDTVAEMKRLAKHLAEKYRANEVVEAARRPGAQGDQLTQLYLDRAYRLVEEDYEAVRDLDTKIEKLK